MHSRLAAALLVASITGCSRSSAPAPAAPAPEHTAAVPLDEHGQRYVIVDARTKRCLLVADAGATVTARRESCARLAANHPEIAARVTWDDQTSVTSAAPSPASAEPSADDTAPRRPELPADQPAAPDENAASDAPANDLSAGIHERGNNRYDIEREALEAVLANPSALARSARIVPAQRDGKPIGFKIYAVRRGSLFAALGLVNGDTIRRVNGHELTGPEQALEVYVKLREVDEIRVDLVRRGEELTFVYRLLP